MKVVANERGYFGTIREQGDVFEVPDNIELKDAWFTPVAVEPVKKPAAPPKKGEKPMDDSLI